MAYIDFVKNGPKCAHPAKIVIFGIQIVLMTQSKKMDGSIALLYAQIMVFIPDFKMAAIGTYIIINISETLADRELIPATQ